MLFRRALCLLVVASAACRNYIPPNLNDMEAPLPNVAWAPGAATPMSQPLAGMPTVLTPAALVGFGGTPMTTPATYSYALATNTWSTLTPTGAPVSGRVGHCAAYLPTQNRALFVGGRDGSGTMQLPLLLSLTTPAFSSLTGNAPTPTDGCAAAYFAKTSTAVIFGGETGLTPSGDTWSFDPSTMTFSQLMPSGLTPAPRSGAALIADPGPTGNVADSQLLLFDGVGECGEIDELWRWDGTDWGELATLSDPNAMNTDVARPPGRANAVVALDTTRRVLYVFGGERQGVDLNDLWRLDLWTLAWTNLNLDSGPTAREQSSTAYDPTSDRMLIFGGLTQNTPLADGWTLAPVK